MTFPSFEGYLEDHHGGWADHGGDCDSCGREASRVTAGRRGPYRVGEGMCEWCVRYAYGYDQGQARTIELLLGGAIRAALESEEINVREIGSAVAEAIEADHEREVASWARRK